MKKFVFILLLCTVKAHAYPEMIRHHYVNCTACHFSPAGGGLLTSYGRTISTEVLSTWGDEKEARSFYGAMDNEKLNQWLAVGGNLRALQFHHESKTVVEGRTIPMQAGLEFVAFWKKWSAELFVGKLDKDWKVDPVGTRFYLMYQFLDELTVRVGRFLPVFGLNIPQHSVVTRSKLGFNQGQERNAVEGMWSGEKWNFALTASQSLRNSSVGEVENGLATQINYTIADSYRIGASYWVGAGDTQERQILGVHAVLGFNEKLYLLTESDLQTKKNKVTSTTEKGVFHFTKLGYEFFKGFHFQLVGEYSQSNLDNTKTKFDSFGPGFLWYPRPHFELEGLYAKKKIYLINDNYEDYAYLMAHYYF